ncbi:MAG: NusG-like protein [Acidobacteriia bacterium]|nr:NusG-like protein [Terriglobia bacterium]
MIVSAILRSKGYEEFLPTYRVKRKWSDRIKEIETPLFTGYVFCRLNSGVPWSIVTTPGVVRIVGTRKDISVIDDKEIEVIQRVMKAGVKVEPCAYAKIGDRVRITNGPLSGVQGIVTGYKNQQHLVLSVDLIQSSVSVEVDGYDLAPITKPSTAASDNCASVPHSGIFPVTDPILVAG